MSAILLASIAIRVFALLTALRLLIGNKDYRMGFFIVTIAVMVVDQLLPLFQTDQLWPIVFEVDVQTLTALFVSILIFLTLVYLDAVLRSYRYKSLRLTAARKKLQREVDANQAVKEALGAAEMASRTKSQFLANMSHELRTPLNAVIGFSEIMEAQMFGPLGSPQYKEYATDIKTSGKHLLGIVNDVLDLSKVEAGRIELKETVIEIPELLASCERLVKESARAGELELAFKIFPDLPYLMADQRLVKQVLVNLLSNAVKFTHQGGEILVTATTAPGVACRIEVRDNGIGMLPAHIDKALQPFAQIENAAQSNHKGTGLGLPLSKSLVELHGGTFEIESQLGAGTKIIVTFPAERAVAPADLNSPRDLKVLAI